MRLSRFFSNLLDNAVKFMRTDVPGRPRQGPRDADGERAVQCLFGGGCAGHLLVLLDLNLPDMSGIDILQRLKTDSRVGANPRDRVMPGGAKHIILIDDDVALARLLRKELERHRY